MLYTLFLLTTMSKSRRALVPSDPSRIVTHTQYGVWDYYEERDPDAGHAFFSSLGSRAKSVIEPLPYLVRAVKDIIATPGCKIYIGLYTIAEMGGAILPAITIW